MLPRADEHQVAADGIGSVLIDVFIGVDDVAAALGHALAVRTQNDALIEEAQHGFVEVDDVHVPQRLGEEAGVEQMHGGVLDAAGVLIDRQPVAAAAGVPRHVGCGQGLARLVVGIDVGVLIPAGAHEGVHGIGLALGAAVALRTIHVAEAFMIVEGAFAGGLTLTLYAHKKFGSFILNAAKLLQFVLLLSCFNSFCSQDNFPILLENTGS